MQEAHSLSLLPLDIITDLQTCHQSHPRTGVGKQDYGASQTQLQCSGYLIGPTHDKDIVVEFEGLKFCRHPWNTINIVAKETSLIIQ